MKPRKNVSGFISGIVLLLFGIWLIYLGFLHNIIILGLYGAVALGLGAYMLLNLNKEDTIERVRRK